METLLVVSCFKYFIFVLILPMRNGNSTPIPPFNSLGLFLSYLWGMETERVLTNLVGEDKVLILPMRNGNGNFLQLSWSCSFRSYPTYEEWKPFSDHLTFGFFACSYPTYEEWKLGKFFCLKPASSYVLILPMRNGNYAKTIESE